ncbi:MAG: hypothetical protein ABSG21_10570 [Spirochaetia bacterium]|jgi:hypothetical protein
MGEFSAIRKEDEQWVFDYWAGTDPSGELHNAGAILAEAEVGDVRLGSGLQNATYWGKAYTETNTEAALRAVQANLIKLDWRQRPDE